jgi:hypothetical protein
MATLVANVGGVKRSKRVSRRSALQRAEDVIRRGGGDALCGDDIAEALGVTYEELDADSPSMGCSALYYHGPALIAIEAAYERGKAEGREALLAALSQYFADGCEAERRERESLRG